MTGIRIKGLCVLKGKQMPKAITPVEFHGCAKSVFFCQNNTAKRFYALNCNAVMVTELWKGLLEAQAFNENVQGPVVDSKTKLMLESRSSTSTKTPCQNQLLNTDFFFFFASFIYYVYLSLSFFKILLLPQMQILFFRDLHLIWWAPLKQVQDIILQLPVQIGSKLLLPLSWPCCLNPVAKELLWVLFGGDGRLSQGHEGCC